MTAVTPISSDTHRHHHWRRYNSYTFAAGDAVATLVAQELPRACMHMPIGFVESDGHYLPVAVQGLQAGVNLYAHTDGRWLAGYVPAVYRGFPFSLHDTTDGRQVLCVQDGQLCEPDPAGQTVPLFDETGELSAPTRDVLQFLSQVHAGRQATRTVCDLLHAHGVIQPWAVTLKDDQGEHAVGGLFRIDEAALRALPADAFEAIRASGALPVIYCQLLSMQHLSTLGQLVQARLNAAPAITPSGDLDLDFLNDGGSIRFD